MESLANPMAATEAMAAMAMGSAARGATRVPAAMAVQASSTTAAASAQPVSALREFLGAVSAESAERLVQREESSLSVEMRPGLETVGRLKFQTTGWSKPLEQAATASSDSPSVGLETLAEVLEGYSRSLPMRAAGAMEATLRSTIWIPSIPVATIVSGCWPKVLAVAEESEALLAVCFRWVLLEEMVETVGMC